jgi:integrase
LLQYKLTLKKPPVVHYPAASLETAPAIFRAVQEAEGTVFRAIEFAILTTVRPGVALRARWSEINQTKALWVIPAGRMKGGREFTVPLVPAAMAVLAAQERVRAHETRFPPVCCRVARFATTCSRTRSGRSSISRACRCTACGAGGSGEE